MFANILTWLRNKDLGLNPEWPRNFNFPNRAQNEESQNG